MQLFQLPNDTVAAIKKGGDFRGKDGYLKWKETRQYPFPNAVDPFFDRKLMKFFNAHLVNIDTNHRKQIERSPDEGKQLIADAQKNMVGMVKAESNFESENLSKFVRVYAARFFKHHTASLGNGISGTIGKIAFANAVSDLWKNFHIEEAIAGLYLAEARVSLIRAAISDQLKRVNPIESYNGMVDAVERIFK